MSRLNQDVEARPRDPLHRPLYEWGTTAQPLLRPVRLGDLDLPNRVVMAPMSRARADNPELVPTDLTAAYYAQRATAGMIITESTLVSERAVVFDNVAGIYTDEQVAAWGRVTGVVHALGGRIVQQLCYMGTDGRTVTPDTMAIGDVEETVREWHIAAKNARRAGFDGVEIAAHGVYMIAQFLNARLNRRADRYGSHRHRLLLEVVDAVAAAWPARRIGVRLTPWWSIADQGRSGQPPGDYPYVPDEPTLADYDRIVAELNQRHLAYLHLRGPNPGDTATPNLNAFVRYRRLFDGPLIANHGFDRDAANAVIAANSADAVSFARPYIANPDLVARFALGHDLAVSDRATYYAGGAHGYIDYPAWPC